MDMQITDVGQDVTISPAAVAERAINAAHEADARHSPAPANPVVARYVTALNTMVEAAESADDPLVEAYSAAADELIRTPMADARDILFKLSQTVCMETAPDEAQADRARTLVDNTGGDESPRLVASAYLDLLASTALTPPTPSATLQAIHAEFLSAWQAFEDAASLTDDVLAYEQDREVTDDDWAIWTAAMGRRDAAWQALLDHHPTSIAEAAEKAKLLTCREADVLGIAAGPQTAEALVALRDDLRRLATPAPRPTRAPWDAAVAAFEAAKARQREASAVFDATYPGDRPAYPEALHIPTSYNGYEPDPADIKAYFPPEVHADKLALLARWEADHAAWCAGAGPDQGPGHACDEAADACYAAERELLRLTPPDTQGLALKLRILFDWMEDVSCYSPRFDPADPEWRRVADLKDSIHQRAMISIYDQVQQLSAPPLPPAEDEVASEDDLVAMFAATEIEAWTIPCPVPRNDEAGGFAGTHFPSLRIAYLTMTKSKSELLELARGLLEPDHEDKPLFVDLAAGLQHTAKVLKGWSDMTEAAEARLLLATSAALAEAEAAEQVAA